jgi:hypothetical protein
MMIRGKTLLVAIVLGHALSVQADTSLSAYGTYWNGDENGRGGGLRLRKTILAFSALEARGGYVDFEEANAEIFPVEAAVSLRLPFLVSPYAGVGTGYYFIESDVPGLDDGNGYFVQAGVEITLLWFGAMAEIRYHDLEEDVFDGPAAHVGLLLKW